MTDAPVPLLTVAEVAARLRVSKMTVYRWIADLDEQGHGDEVVRVRRTLRVKESALDRLSGQGQGES